MTKSPMRLRITELYSLLQALGNMHPQNPMDIDRIAKTSRAAKDACPSLAYAVMEMANRNWGEADLHLADARSAITKEGGRP